MTGVTDKLNRWQNHFSDGGGMVAMFFRPWRVAHRLRQLGWNIEWLGTEQGIEARVVKQANISL